MKLQLISMNMEEVLNWPEINEKLSKQGKISQYDRKKGLICTFGFTGAGKSSLLSYLIGGELKWDTVGDSYSLKNVKNGIYPEIGNRETSCTALSQLFEYNSFRYVDLPGCQDTEGSTQQILNAATITNVFTKSTSLKILIVIEYSSLKTQRGGGLVNIVNRLFEHFGQNLKKIAQSCLLVVTKVNSVKCSKEFIKEKVGKIIKQRQDIQSSPLCLKLLQTILNKDRIILFPLPQLITGSFVTDVQMAIRRLQSTVLQQDAAVSLSEKAKKYCCDYESKIIINLLSIMKEISQDFRNQYKKISYFRLFTTQNLLVKCTKQLSSAKKMRAETDSQYAKRVFEKSLQLSSAKRQKILQAVHELSQLRRIFSKLDAQSFQNLINRTIVSTLEECSKSLNQLIRQYEQKEEEKRLRQMQEQRRQRERRSQQDLMAYYRRLEIERYQREQQQRERIRSQEQRRRQRMLQQQAQRQAQEKRKIQRRINQQARINAQRRSKSKNCQIY